MNKQTKEFLIKLIEEQKQYVLEAEKGYNKIASGIFKNECFTNFIFENYSSEYLKELKEDWSASCPKNLIVSEMNRMIEKLNEL